MMPRFDDPATERAFLRAERTERGIAIRALIAFVSQHTFRGFAWYRIAFGLLMLAVYWNSGF